MKSDSEIIEHVNGSQPPISTPIGNLQDMTFRAMKMVRAYKLGFIDGSTSKRGEVDEMLDVPTREEFAVITTKDPDTQLDVEVALFKCPYTGGIFGIDASFIANADPDFIMSPFVERRINL